MKKNIYVRAILILLSIFTVFGAVPCVAETAGTEECCCVEQPEYVDHTGCLPVVEGEAAHESEPALASEGYAESEIILPASWSTSEDYALLTAEEQANCEAIYEGLMAMSSKITLPHRVTTTVTAALYKRVIYSSPELFYVNSSYGYSYTMVGSVQYVVAVSPKYTMTSTEVAEARVYIEDEVAVLVALCDESWSDMEKVLFYHDYLALHFEYDRRLYTQGSDYVNYDIYNFLKEDTGVCMAYQLLLMALLDEVGVENSYAENGGHIWNVVKVNGEWYHVDVTWDDPIVNSTEYNGFHGLVEHESFLKSDTAFTSIGYEEWNCDYTCTDTTYDANTVINNAYSAFVIADEGWYYIDKENAKVMLYDVDTGTTTAIASISPTLTTCYASIYKYGDYLIYNGAYSIFAYDTVNKTTKTLQTKSASGYILGFTVTDAVADYIVGTAFAESGWTHETYSLCDSGDVGRISLKDGSLVTIDTADSLIENITSTENTLSDIKALIANSSSNVTVKDAQGSEITSDSALVGTGCTITLTIDGVEKETLTVVVDCDVDGDGSVTVADALCTMNDVYFKSHLDGVYRTAADYNHNDAISVLDVMNVLNNIV